MRVGMTMFFQNYADWDRYEAKERGANAPDIDPQSDVTRYEEELDTALAAEDQGWDSLWTVEHHISPYTMIPNPVQLLSFIAGATSRIDVGTMVVVLPWHHPLRVAEDITTLQYQLRGRTPYIGFGRGAARREFRQLGFEMGESRERFDEAIQVVQLALAQESFSFHGKHYDFENVTMRPRPKDPQALIDNFHFSWGSPSSAPVGARYGLKPLIIPQRAWAEYHADLEEFARARAEAGHAPARPRIHMNVFCGQTEQEAEEGARRYIPQYADSARRNYELDSDHFRSTKGYEHYAAQSTNLRGTGDAAKAMGDAYLANHVWGTPDQCIEKMRGIAAAFHPEEFMLVMRYGDMPRDVAATSTDLFAREVLPAVQAVPLEEPIVYGAAASI
ncbi:LLM class flavin-dependent oxidoreductase [Pseudonocardia alaniniphila]|uniref:LLM class flavin-dependent oxidoreductase n=1 Tax=Pseudonocardia alaniniphila TaxID=75291 RepID=A0ABS9TP83_9PSEU|nr:LLM class flavin-dependent oxidoreductase [Pseudonocardia alaniniphila]MCH6170321.1 LLM class flavin-dependent oxidoreductase [Pseudonocardia alaniniphila]